MNDFKIEKGVEMPRTNFGRGGSGSASKYPFAKMEVGDSFQFECNDDDYNRIRSAAYMHKRKRGYIFAFRKIAEGSYRCWRIE